MSLADIRAGLATALEDAGLGLRVFAYEPFQVPWPAAVIGWPQRYVPHDTFGETEAMVIPVRIEVAVKSDRAATDALNDFLELSGSSSVVAAIEADPTLGGACSSAWVSEWTSFVSSVVEDGFVVSATALVEVLA